MTGAGLEAFNSLPDGEATDRLLACLHAPNWAGAVLSGRPYPDRESLLATAYRFGVVLDEADLISALSGHPRIGERPAGGGRVNGAASRQEQSGVDAADADLATQLRDGNLAYEDRFGQVFLIRAAGRSGPEILAALHERLANDAGTEANVVRDQLAQIAQLRLDGVLAGLSEGANG